MQEKLNVVIEERREDAEREAAERRELEAKRQQAIEYIISLGLDPESLLAPVTADTVKTRRKAKGGVRKAKYRFKDENGEIREWSGNGKRPLALQKLLDEGHFMEDFLIDKLQPGRLNKIIVMPSQTSLRRQMEGTEQPAALARNFIV